MQASTWTRRVLWAAILVALAIGLSFALRATSQSDENCIAAARMSPFQVANGLYLTHSGRWLGMLLYAFSAKAVDLHSWRYGVMAAISFPIWFSGFYLIARTVLSKDRLLFASLMLAVFWSGAPSAGEVFAWTGGMIIYGIPFALLCATIFLLSRRSCWAVAPAIAASLINELSGIAIIVGLIPFLRRREAQVVLLGAALATAIVVLSPGNAMRAQLNHAMGRTLSPRLLFYMVRPYDSPWVLDARMLAMIIFVGSLPKAVRERDLKTIFTYAVTLLICTAAVTIGALIAPAARVLDFFFAGTVALAFYASLSLRWNVPEWFSAGALAVAILTGPSVREAFHKQIPTAPTVTDCAWMPR